MGIVNTGIVIAVVVLLWHEFYNRDMIRVEWDVVARFVAFLALVSCARIAYLEHLITEHPIAENVIIYKQFSNMMYQSYHFLMVFWEDTVFGMSCYYLYKYLKKRFAIPLIVLVSIFFGLGHAYEGLVAIGVASLYPFFISRPYGEKYGFGTVAVCHILYDFSVFLILSLFVAGAIK